MSTDSCFPNVNLILHSNYGKFLCEIDKDFITDKFNLTGIPQEFVYFEKVYKILLSDKPLAHTTDVNEYDFYDLLTLYGLIHARYIISPSGLHRMRKKFLNRDFGSCPRYFCRKQHLVPVGLSSTFNDNFPRVFCPNCEDVYDLEDKFYNRMDGSFYGPTFPMFFFLTYPELFSSRNISVNLERASGNPARITNGKGEVYCPKIFGFKLFNKIKLQAMPSPSEVADC